MTARLPIQREKNLLFLLSTWQINQSGYYELTLMYLKFLTKGDKV